METLTALLKATLLVNHTISSGNSLLLVAVQAHRTNAVALLEPREPSGTPSRRLWRAGPTCCAGFLPGNRQGADQYLTSGEFAALAADEGMLKVARLLLECRMVAGRLIPGGSLRWAGPLAEPDGTQADLLVGPGAVETAFDAVFNGQLAERRRTAGPRQVPRARNQQLRRLGIGGRRPHRARGISSSCCWTKGACGLGKPAQWADGPARGRLLRPGRCRGPADSAGSQGGCGGPIGACAAAPGGSPRSRTQRRCCSNIKPTRTGG